MSTVEQRAFENLQRLAVQFRDIIAIGPELAAVGSLKQAKDEAQARLDEVRRQIGDERAAHEAALEAERVKIIAQAHADAKGIKSDAEAGVAGLREKIDRANDEAARVKAEAAAEASSVRESVAAMQTQLAQLNVQIKDNQTVEAEWRAKASAAKDEHDRVVSIHQEFVSKVGLR
jgi:chromosome segregation ATPase